MPGSPIRMLIRGAVPLAIAGFVYEARHYVLSVHPNAHSGVQRVTLLNQPGPEPPRKPPPEPEAKQPATLQKPDDTNHPFRKFEDCGPENDQPVGPRDDNLGVDAEGGPGSDSFGLVGKRGGQDITTIGSAPIGGGSGPRGRGQNGAMAKFAGYATLVKETVTTELNSHDTLKVARYEAIVMVWIDPGATSVE